MPSREKREKCISNGMCAGCGKVEVDGNTKCIKCRFHATQAAHKHKRNMKSQAVELFGGKCNDCRFKCKYPDVFDFHHIEEKSEEINKLLRYRSWEKLESELKKCVMLCANCHRIRHAKEREGVNAPSR